jgi:multidrug efflux system outer membrane protein
MHRPNTYRSLLTLLTIGALLASCKVTAPYQEPSSMIANNLYRDINTTDTTTIADMPWQQLFTYPILQSLIAEGLRNNLDLGIAITNITQAAANLAQRKAAFFPNLNATANATFDRLSSAQAGDNPQNYLLALNAGWEADLWGKLKSAKRAALAALLQSDAYKRAVQTNIVASIANNYYALMAYDAQLQITLETVELRKQDVEDMQSQKGNNTATDADVTQSKANRYAAEVTIPDLKQNIRETENTLCILLGRPPGNINRDSLSNATVATDLRTGVTAQLLSNRPDVQQAAYQVRESFEMVNVAKAHFYPSFTITAQGGLNSAAINQFFDAAAILGSIFGGLTQPIFNNGLNKRRLVVAQANQEASLLSFKKALLKAGEEVSNALFNYQVASDKMIYRAQLISNLQESVLHSKSQMKAGGNTNYTDILTSEQSLLAAELNGVSDKLQQLQAVVLLYRNLGGGWQ